MADDSVHQELEDLRFSDEDDDDVKVILNNKATDGNNDSFSETPSPSECNLNNLVSQEGLQKILPQTSNRFLNESFEKQSLCGPGVESDLFASVVENEQSSSVSLASVPEKYEVETVDFHSEEMPQLENEFEKLTVDPTIPESFNEPPTSEEVEAMIGSNGDVDEGTMTEKSVNDVDLESFRSESKSGKQLRPDAPVFMPSFMKAEPQELSSADTKTISETHLEPSAEPIAEGLDSITFSVEFENRSVLEPEPEYPATNTLNSTPKSSHFVSLNGLDELARNVSEEPITSSESLPHFKEPLLSKDSLQSSALEKDSEKPSVDSKSTSAYGVTGFDSKIKQLVASNYINQSQVEALKQDQKRLLLLHSNAKVPKSKKHTFDMMLEEMNKLQVEIRSLKMEKEQLERKLRTTVKQSSSSDAKSLITEALTASQRQDVSCQSAPNFETEKKLLAFKSAQNELQVAELKNFLGKLYMQNALPSTELLFIAEAVTRVETKLTGNSLEQMKHIAKLSDLQSVNEMREFNPPFPGLASEISNLRCEIFDKMLNSLNGAKRVQVSPPVPGTSNGFCGLLSGPKEVLGSSRSAVSSAKEEPQNGSQQSGSESASETESEEEQTKVAFRVPTKKPQVVKPVTESTSEASKLGNATGARVKQDSHSKKTEPAQSSANVQSDTSSNGKNMPAKSSAKSLMDPVNDKSDISRKSSTDHVTLSRSNSVSSGSQNEQLSSSANTNSSSSAANSTKRKVDNIIEELLKLYPGKNRSELTELIKLSGQYLSKKGYNMTQITVQDVVEGAKHVGKQLGYAPAS